MSNELPDDGIEAIQNPEEIGIEHKTFLSEGEELEFPLQPLSSFTRKRFDRLPDYAYEEADLDNFDTEDLPVVIEEDRWEKLDNQSVEGSVYRSMKEEFRDAHQSSNKLFGRYVFGKKSYLLNLSRKTHGKLMETADKAGMNFYVAPYVTAEDVLTEEDIREYLNMLREIKQELDTNMRIVPVIDLTVSEIDTGIVYSRLVEGFDTTTFPFIGVNGEASIYTNRATYYGIKGQTDRPLLVDNCPKKIDGSKYDEFGVMSRELLYLMKGANIVLEKKWIPRGGSDNKKFELLNDSGRYKKRSVSEAESEIPDVLPIEENRSRYEDRKEIPNDFNQLHNELKFHNIVDGIQENLSNGSTEEDILSGRTELRQSVEALNQL
jgi:hypothetical protein